VAFSEEWPSAQRIGFYRRTEIQGYLQDRVHPPVSVRTGLRSRVRREMVKAETPNLKPRPGRSGLVAQGRQPGKVQRAAGRPRWRARAALAAARPPGDCWVCVWSKAPLHRQLLQDVGRIFSWPIAPSGAPPGYVACRDSQSSHERRRRAHGRPARGCVRDVSTEPTTPRASRSYFFEEDAAITTDIGENARPCTPWKPVTTGVTTPVFRSSRPTSLTTFAAV
jgi:hypothetical protein